jgi:hypothetical protein
MQSAFHLLIAPTAPHTAEAFGNMNCISIESCDNANCGPASDPPSITFDWTDNLTVLIAGEIEKYLPKVSNANDAGGSRTVMGNDVMNRLSRTEASKANVLAYFPVKNCTVTTLAVQYYTRQAA